MLDQVLGIGGLTALVYVSVRLTVTLRSAWHVERDGELEPVLEDR